MKDRIDITDLLIKCHIDYEEYKNILEKEKLIDFKKRLIDIVTKLNEIKYFNLNPRQFKLKKEEIAKKIKETY